MLGFTGVQPQTEVKACTGHIYWDMPNYPGYLLSNAMSGWYDANVREVQFELSVCATASNHPEYNPGPVDGYFGIKTRLAVINWQRAHKLTQDGIVGSSTWNSIKYHN